MCGSKRGLKLQLFIIIMSREIRATSSFYLVRLSFPPYSSKKYHAGFLRTLAILIRVRMDGSNAPVS